MFLLEGYLIYQILSTISNYDYIAEKDKRKEWNIEKLSFLKRKKKGNCWKFKKMLLKQHKVILLMFKIQILRGKGRKNKNNLRNNHKKQTL